ncbi:MAG: helix-turn-helix domain-containing protein [Porphyromonas sp.]|nr:helix-turn-helix domain-containing protein [Porphyromonas sp.]
MKRIERKKRLSQAFDHLKLQGRVEYYGDVARQMGKNELTVRGAFSLKSNYLSESFLHDFLSTYKGTFSEEWLLEGKGEMLLSSAPYFSGEMTKESWQRVQEVMDREGLSVREFSSEIGVSESTVRRIFQNESRPKNRTLDRILARYPYISREWLYYGEGEAVAPAYRISQPASGKMHSNAQPYLVNHTLSAVVIPDAAAAGALSGYAESVLTGLPEVQIPVDRPHSGEYFIFTVSGASMDDGSISGIADGDLVVGRRIAPEYWSQGLHFHDWRYFVFITRSMGLIVKSIADQDLEQGTILCRSLNPDYSDITLHLSDLTGIYNVVSLIRRNLKQ